MRAPGPIAAQAMLEGRPHFRHRLAAVGPDDIVDRLLDDGDLLLRRLERQLVERFWLNLIFGRFMSPLCTLAVTPRPEPVLPRSDDARFGGRHRWVSRPVCTVRASDAHLPEARDGHYRQPVTIVGPDVPMSTRRRPRAKEQYGRFAGHERADRSASSSLTQASPGRAPLCGPTFAASSEPHGR